MGRFLGKGYTVKASVGHVRDLLRSQLSVDVENDFAPKYRVPNEKSAGGQGDQSPGEEAAEIYLATDPDREGEAIAWHLLESAKIDPKLTQRVVFHEITEPAIADAFAHPREINMDLVDAQQARRVLDRLVGYNLSPLLWRKVRSRLSAGRVQSVALRLVVEREREIDAFVPGGILVDRGRVPPREGQGDASSPSWRRWMAKTPFWATKPSSSPFWRIWKPAAYAITQDQARRAPAQPVGALHHQHPAAGSLPPPGLHRPAHHGPGAAAL